MQAMAEEKKSSQQGNSNKSSSYADKKKTNGPSGHLVVQRKDRRSTEVGRMELTRHTIPITHWLSHCARTMRKMALHFKSFAKKSWEKCTVFLKINLNPVKMEESELRCLLLLRLLMLQKDELKEKCRSSSSLIISQQAKENSWFKENKPIDDTLLFIHVIIHHPLISCNNIEERWAMHYVICNQNKDNICSKIYIVSVEPNDEIHV